MLSAAILGILLGVASADATDDLSSDATAEAIVPETSTASEPMQPERRVNLVVSRAADVDYRRRATIQIVSTRPIADSDEAKLTAAVPRGSPVGSGYVTSTYGRRYNPVTKVWGNHRGIDLAAAHGSPVYATADGVVTHAGWRGSYGILIVVKHGGGVETRYAHLSRVAVTAGAKIKNGDVLGYVGSTGRSTGPHLHYEIRRNGAATNPGTSVDR